MPRRPKTLSLESAIATDCGKKLPHPLPVAHMSLARWASDILGSRALTPRFCRIFDRELLYLLRRRLLPPSARHRHEQRVGVSDRLPLRTIRT
jgi:hypothetical protein